MTIFLFSLLYQSAFLTKIIPSHPPRLPTVQPQDIFTRSQSPTSPRWPPRSTSDKRWIKRKAWWWFNTTDTVTRLSWAEAGTMSIHFRFLAKKKSHLTFKFKLSDQRVYRLKIAENAPTTIKIFKIFWGGDAPRPP